jgi:hypothetical protein
MFTGGGGMLIGSGGTVRKPGGSFRKPEETSGEPRETSACANETLLCAPEHFHGAKETFRCAVGTSRETQEHFPWLVGAFRSTVETFLWRLECHHAPPGRKPPTSASFPGAAAQTRRVPAAGRGGQRRRSVGPRNIHGALSRSTRNGRMARGRWGVARFPVETDRNDGGCFVLAIRRCATAFP